MDRSLKWRTLTLIGIVLLCVGSLLPSVTEPEQRPSWYPFERKINLGLDLKGGLHIVYSIDLNTAIVDRASEIQRDLRARFADEYKDSPPEVRAPLSPLGALTVDARDATRKAEIEALVKADYGSTVEMRDCEEGDPANAVCFKVATTYAEGIKKAALENAVNTIRERIDEKGVAEPSVVQKDEQIIVELPGLDRDRISETRDLIARTAKLEFKVVDDGSRPGQSGSAGSDYMRKLYAHVGSMTKAEAAAAGGEEDDPTDPLAKEMGISIKVDWWRPEESDAVHQDFYLMAHDRPNVLVTREEAKKYNCLDQRRAQELTWRQALIELMRKQGVFGDVSATPADMVRCDLKGWQVIERYLTHTTAANPDLAIDDQHQIAYELVEPERGKDTRPFWRSYYLWRTVELTGTSISDASGAFEPNTGRPIVLLDFNRYGGRVFGDLTSRIVGQKLATILDDKVKSAPIINGAIRGGRASITMGGADPNHQLRERDDLVNVLKTGSLPAPLREESISEVGPTLGRDAIDKAKLAFGLGIVLVIGIMVTIYRWSGWISIVSLLFFNLITFSVMAIFGATLTLPGVAAVVLSVGMTVDGNILIYERIREELNLGKSVRGAVDLGFSRAFSAILDGQLTTAAAGWVLLQYGSGPIKGFATLLLVGVFTTIFTNVWISRVFFDWYIAKKKGQMATISI
jgi:preprotein translocase subunit SecD